VEVAGCEKHASLKHRSNMYSVSGDVRKLFLYHLQIGLSVPPLCSFSQQFNICRILGAHLQKFRLLTLLTNIRVG